MKRFNVLVLVLLVSQHALCVEVKEGAESVPLNCSQHALCVEVKEGAESVLLPCSYNDSPVDGVLWKRDTLIVHARNSSGDDLWPQDKSYVNRTSMRSDAPEGGNLNLILTTPSVNDSGNYTCTAKFKGLDLKNALVLLIVRGRGETVESKSVLVEVLIPLAVIVVLAGVAIISFFCWKKRRNRGGQQEMNLEPLSTSVLKVEVESGAESVQLPFKTKQDLPEDSYLKWWLEEQSKIVHVFCTNPDVREEQHEDYRGRTQMSEDPLRTGDLSLTLKHPIDSDRNIYSCTISRDEQVLGRKQVELQVKVLKVEVDSGAESVQLPFNTTVNLSEDSYLKWSIEPYKIVHVLCANPDVHDKQHEDYRGRTHMSEDPLTTGDLSLTLRHPTVSDSNTYSCVVWYQENHFLGEKTVQLEVKAGILGEDETINNRRRSFTDPTPLMADQSDQ